MRKKKFTFIDLFAGIGGVRMGFERSGGECVYSSEWNPQAQKTYEVNFGEMPEGDITKVDAKTIPDHDVLLAGFPCQPFSIAGVSKKKSLKMPHGFMDKTQGTLFFDVARIIREKKPKAFLLENVKNLKSHDNGRTFETITDTLRKDLGYTVFTKVMDAKCVVPQHRERILIVGFREPTLFSFPEIRNRGVKVRDILEEKPDGKYVLTTKLWKYLKDYAKKHREKGNGFGYGLADLDGVSRTLSARYYKDGSEILIPRGGNRNPRRLTPRECARLMGFPDTFKIVVSDTQAYKQFGNSVVVPLVEVVARRIVKTLEAEGEI